MLLYVEKSESLDIDIPTWVFLVLFTPQIQYDLSTFFYVI